MGTPYRILLYLLILGGNVFNTWRHPDAITIIVLVVWSTFVLYDLSRSIHRALRGPAPVKPVTSGAVYRGALVIAVIFVTMVAFAIWQLLVAPLWIGLLIAGVTVWSGYVFVPLFREQLAYGRTVAAREQGRQGS